LKIEFGSFKFEIAEDTLEGLAVCGLIAMLLLPIFIAASK
jgi:hypothetical protein